MRPPPPGEGASLSVRSRVFILFALGYFVSYVFRGVNLGFAPFITRELDLSAADLGLLTSLYFLGFAAAQIPVGVLLDTFGPRKVDAGLLLIAALGIAVFGTARGIGTMMLGRLLIGIGVAGCFSAALKALAQVFPAERLPLMNGLVMAVGGFGGVVIGTPLAWTLTWTGWRMVCFGLAGLTLATAAAIWVAAPDARRASPRPVIGWAAVASQFDGTWRILSSAVFWRIASFTCVTQGVFYATQSLWVGAYLRDVSTVDPRHAGALVSVLGIAMMAGCVGFGLLAKVFERRGLSVHAFCGIGMAIFVVDQILIILDAPVPPMLLWALYGFVGGTGVLGYAVLAEQVPPTMIGRSITALTLVLFLLIFVFQIGIGFVVNRWVAVGGHYPAQAHRFAWSLLVGLQLLSAIWYVMPKTTATVQDRPPAPLIPG